MADTSPPQEPQPVERSRTEAWVIIGVVITTVVLALVLVQMVGIAFSD